MRWAVARTASASAGSRRFPGLLCMRKRFNKDYMQTPASLCLRPFFQDSSSARVPEISEISVSQVRSSLATSPFLRFIGEVYF